MALTKARERKDITGQIQRKVQERQRPAKMEPPPETRSVRERLRRLQDEGRQQQPRRKSIDRDSR